MVFALDLNGDGEPLNSLGRLDLVAIAPVPPGVLHVVIQDELIHGGDHIEIAFPGDIVGLDDGDFFHNAADADDASNKGLFIYKHHGIEVFQS